MFLRLLLPFLLTLGFLAPLSALDCGRGKPFPQWLKAFERYAVSQGISPDTVHRALDGITYDPSVIRRDRRQHQFSYDFRTFAKRIISPYRLRKGKQLIHKKARLFKAIEKRYGVPAPVIVAFWGLESDFGAYMGKDNTLRSLATLAYDCRRSDEFQKELLAALKIIDEGDLTPRQMRGSWAGELGQTQFLPSYYLKYGVDFDGDGRRDLIHSSADALASTANYLRHLGWKPGEPWIREVIVPRQMPWDESGLEHSHSLSYWGKLGVTDRNGRPLHGSFNASLLLPMGKDGPAFLAFDNFKDTYLTWNNSLLYSLTAAYFATRLDGAPAMRPDRAKIASLSGRQIQTLQRLLAKRGYDVGKIDGIIGEKTRLAVKDLQKKLGLPADGYPTQELLRRLR
ncbi:lytic murein transglycosylase [Nitratifractor salsuginis]|uniref:Lytic murein transglycosylase n=1 Tax=Nitratifractor salsuginis (strain DSM 16511 / JCM 12458 / E9I37-1) TaxID=749222 RepID=E6WZS1_NITSE|nr:lytic murein transglycosylase [Nitratifractor salsuginis]ADV46712.1 lytic murein transglycosylase [Nitratifractor salsuginis DSM 16511]